MNLREFGLLLESDPRLPCVTRIIVGRRLRSSWWGHPKAELIYAVSNRLSNHRDVLTVKLVAGKVTFVHRRLWAAVIAVATSSEEWQFEGLAPATRRLFTLVSRKGILETNQLPGYERQSRAVAGAARELERRLLVYGQDFHTSSGAHAKRLETWERWARRTGFTGSTIETEGGKKMLEEILAHMSRGADVKKLLPWHD